MCVYSSYNNTFVRIVCRGVISKRTSSSSKMLETFEVFLGTLLLTIVQSIFRIQIFEAKFPSARQYNDHC